MIGTDFMDGVYTKAPVSNFCIKEIFDLVKSHIRLI